MPTTTACRLLAFLIHSVVVYAPFYTPCYAADLLHTLPYINLPRAFWHACRHYRFPSFLLLPHSTQRRVSGRLGLHASFFCCYWTKQWDQKFLAASLTACLVDG